MLKARAEGQRETRERIAKAAAELHEEKGVARTTVTEIAERAGVTRVTVYNHFADLAELMPACAAHYMGRHPWPEFGAVFGLGGSGRAGSRRAHDALRLVPRDRANVGKLFSDRASVPDSTTSSRRTPTAPSTSWRTSWRRASPPTVHVRRACGQ